MTEIQILMVLLTVKMIVILQKEVQLKIEKVVQIVIQMVGQIQEIVSHPMALNGMILMEMVMGIILHLQIFPILVPQRLETPIKIDTVVEIQT